MADKIPDWAKEPIDLTNVPLNSPLFDNINPDGVEQVDDISESTPVASSTEAVPDWAKTAVSKTTTESIPDWAKTSVAETKTPYKPSSFARRAIADTGINLSQGLVGLGEAAVGIADIPTLGYAGKGVEAAEKAIFGGTSKDLQQKLQELKTPELREQEKAVQEAKGVKNTVLALAKNPLAFLNLIEQSLPSMYGGVGVARKVLQKAPKLGSAAALGIGEGSITGGSIAEDARQQSEDGLITPKQAIIATGSGILTGGLGAAGAKIATRLGLDDFESLLLKNTTPAVRKTATENLTRAIKSGFSESTLEELPQSIQEQIAQNLANNRPWDEGVAEAATQGALVGFAVAGGYSGINTTIQNSRIDKEVEKQNAEEGEKKELNREKLIDQTFQDLVTRSEQIKTKTTPEPEVPAEPTTILNKTTLTSWGLNPRSNAFKALEGVDASTPEGLDLVQKTLEANKGKINETVVDDYLKGVESGRPITGTAAVGDEILGGQVDGITGGTQGRYGPSTDFSGSIAGINQAGEADVNAPLENITQPEVTAPESTEVITEKTITEPTVETPTIEETTVEEPMPLQDEAKQVASELKALDRNNPLIENLLDETAVTEQDVITAREELATLKAARETKTPTTLAEEQQVAKVEQDLQSTIEGTPEGKAVVNTTKPAKTLGQALSIIKKQHFDKLNPAQKIIHDVVSGLSNVIKGTYKVMGLEKGEFGKYSPTINKTLISPDAGIETIYHEATHSATVWEAKKHVTMKNGRPVVKGNSKIGQQLVDIFDAAEVAAMQQGKDFGEAFRNMDEFIANAFNNEAFQRFLADQPSVVESPAPLTSLWTDWLNALVDIFKIPNMDKSLLSDLVSVAPDLFVGTRPENLKDFPAVEPLYQRNANKSADQLQDETGIKKLHVGSSKNIFNTLADIDIKHALRNFTSAVFSSDSGLNSAMREAMDKAGLPMSKIKEVVHSMMTSQALHAENIASYFLELGGIRYDTDSFTFEVIPSESGASWGNMMKRIGEISKQYGKSYEKMELHAHTYFVARRAAELIKTNTALKQRVLKLLVDGDKKGAKKLWEKQYKLVHLTKKQIESGLALKDKFPELNEIVDQWNEVRTNVIQFLVDTGYYNQEDATDLVSAMEYVPFYRVAQIEAGAAPREFTRGLLDRTRDKKFKGSYDAVNNVFDNMERWITYSIRKGIGNKTAQNAVKAMEEIMPDDISGPLPPGASNKINPGNKIEVWQNGSPRTYKLEDPLFVHYFTGAQAAFGPLVDFFTPTNRFFRASVIYDPIFSVKQVIMDAQSAMTTSGVSGWYKIPILSVKEFFLTLGDWSTAHKELRARGAVGERSYSEVTSRIDVETRAGLRRPNLAERIVSGALKPFKWFAMVSDNAVRQAVYLQTLKETGDKGAAIARAFEIINFKRSGYSSTVNTARQVIPFFGAYLQALNVIGKTITGRGISPTTRKAAYTRLASTMTQVAMFSFLYAMLMSDDDEYKDADTTTRDLRYFIPGLTDYGVWLPVRADPFTLFTKMFVEHYVNLTKTEQTEDWTKFKKAFKDFAVSAFLGPTPMPQLAKTVLEANMNYNLNTDRAIVGQGLAGRATERQFTSNTSLLARDMSKATGDTVSPVTIDYYMRQLAGSLSGVSIFLYDKLYRDANAPEKSTRDTIAQFAPGFVKKEFGTKAKNDLYELRDLVDEAYQTYTDMSKFATPEEFYKSEQYKKAGEKLSVKPAIDVLIKQLSRNRAAERELRERPPKDMTKEQKEAILKSMKEGERQLLKDIQIFRLKAGLDEDNPFRDKPDWAKE